MKLTEMKKRTLALIEEINPDSEFLTDDIDIQAKINYVIDTKQHELARIKKIPAIETMEVNAGDTMTLQKDIKNFYQLYSITGVDNEQFGDNVEFKESGIATIKYYKYPKMITTETIDNEYTFELSTDVLEIMPYGVAADLLKSDVSAQFGKIYEDAYRNALNMLDTRTSSGTCKIVGGI